MGQASGERFGSKYVLGVELGVGAMGTVHAATDVGTDASVAIKILHRHLASDPKTVARFIQEKDALTKVQHPNVVAVKELIVDDGRLGIVMELVEGRELKQLAADGIDPADAVRICRDVAAGLEEIHRTGIIHRDLKPANIMVLAGDAGPVPKITDFGVSRILDDSTASSTGSVGTPLYLAPEGAQAKPGAQAPADVYSLGVVLFELLVGEPPFTAAIPMAVIRAHAEDRPPRIDGVPAPLADLVDRMLAKDPASRPTAAEARSRLDALLPLLTPGLQPVAIAPPTAAPATVVTPQPSGHQPSVAPHTTPVPHPAAPPSGQQPIAAPHASPPPSGQQPVAAPHASPPPSGQQPVAAPHASPPPSGQQPIAAPHASPPPSGQQPVAAPHASPPPSGQQPIAAPHASPPPSGQQPIASPHASPPPSGQQPIAAPHASPPLSGEQPATSPALHASPPPSGQQPAVAPGVGDLAATTSRPAAVGAEVGAGATGPSSTGSGAQAASVSPLRRWGRGRLILAGCGAFAASLAVVFGVLSLLGRDDDPPPPTGYAFAPRIMEGDVLVNRRWQLLDDRTTLVATVSLLNFGDAPASVDHIEVFAPTLVDDVGEVSFSPAPDELLRDDNAARYRITDLSIDATVELGYVIRLAGEDQQRDLADLAAEHEAATDAFFEGRDDEAVPVEVALLEVVAAPATMMVGDTSLIEIRGQLDDGSPFPFELESSVEWSTTDPAVASIEGGVIQAHATGSVVVGVQLGDASAQATIDVIDEGIVDDRAAGSDGGTGQAGQVPVGPTIQGGGQTGTDDPPNSQPGTEDPPPSVPEDPPPSQPITIVGGPPLASVDGDSARITFNTNVCTTARYSGSGLLHESSSWPNANTRCWTDHFHTFTGLAPGDYTVAVEVRATDNTAATLGAVTFTITPPEPIVIVGGPPVASVDGDSARITFNTNVCTTARYSGSGLLHESSSWPNANTRCWTDHFHTFTGLAPGDYTVAVEVRATDNTAATLGAVTFTITPPEPIVIVGGPPVASVDGDSARITFNTNVCTTARYSGSGLLHESSSWPNANTRCWTDHFHTFTGLAPGDYTVAVEVRATDNTAATLGAVTFTITG